LGHTVTFVTHGSPPDANQIAAWLTAQGEPMEQEEGRLSLRALPLELLVPVSGPVQARIALETDTPLARLVPLLFRLSLELGADVVLAGKGSVTRASMWLQLADAQDRLRIAAALDRAEDRGRGDEVSRALWAVLAASGDGRELVWDRRLQRIVELREVGAPGGIPVDEAVWHSADVEPGDVVHAPVGGYLHTVAWRWLAAAYPGLCEGIP
jgi:hypothetical protein